MLIELVKFGEKVYRPFEYDEAKEVLLGNKVEFICDDDSCCESCEDPMDPGTVCPVESYLVTEVNPEFFVVKGRKVPYIYALQLFSFLDGSPVGVEVELKDKKDSAKPKAEKAEKKVKATATTKKGEAK